ncbi:hypothetical protein R9X47_10540 [Wukongibacter baidiensis]|uniref:hypothetical protein n=1 Tax=Wukongibacter baidiensis TaxID=1723361 RepID=UPI003D7FD803
MADTRKSFEEFYYRPDGIKYEVEVVADYADSHNGDTDIYDREMFCPECKRAGLYFVHKTSKRIAHLRRYPSENHESGCSYNYPYASRKKAQKYINSLSYNEIQDKLDAMINMLCKPKKRTDVSTSTTTHTSSSKNPMVYTEE